MNKIFGYSKAEMDEEMFIDVQMKHTWGSEGNWKESVLSFHYCHGRKRDGRHGAGEVAASLSSGSAGSRK